MKNLAKFFICLAASFGTAVLFSACEPDNGGGNDEPVQQGNTLFVPNEVNGTVTMDFESLSSWEVVNNNPWFSVSPMAGATAGPATLTIVASSVNEELAERVGNFMINDGGAVTSYYVVQEGTSGFEVQASKTIGGHEQVLELPVTTNLEGISATSDVDWVEVGEITYSDPTLLADGETESKLRTATISLNIQANPAEDNRNAVVTVTAGEMTQEVTLTQTEDIGVDFSKDFFRRSFVMKFTATSCGYCPTMTFAIDRAMDQTGRIVPISIYGIMSGADYFVYDYYKHYMNKFMVGGYPNAIVNNYASLGASSVQVTGSLIAQLASEAADTTVLKARTAIGGSATIEGDEIKLHLDIVSKEGGAYNLNIFVVEDGLIAKQSDYNGLIDDPNNCVHNHVVRSQATEVTGGDPIEIADYGITSVDRTIPLPEEYENAASLHLVVYLTYKGTFVGEVGVTYVTYANSIVDNVVDIPTNGATIGIEYED
ncbi:MAG TPA: Omp28-related outer membrane protein [Candidatus Coprenecus pullistercoris]|nr:Omp28-related outer membrane protein [Candidatus Coprenecus pullistercoris]